MLPYLPLSLDVLLSLFSGCFTKPTFRTFRALVVGQISQTQLRTVTGMLVGARLSQVWDHCRAHRFFSRARWSIDELGLTLASFIATRLVDPDAVIVVCVDDTLMRRLGRKIFGSHWHHDATANSLDGSVAWGNNWVVVGILVRPAFLARPICLPVGFRLWRPRRKEIPKGQPDPKRPSKPELARRLVDLLAQHLAGRTIHVVGDAGYAAGVWRGLPSRVTVTFRLRRDAALYEPAPPRTGRRGAPAKKGRRLASLKQIALSPATEWTHATAVRYGKEEAVEVHRRPCLWYGALGPTEVVLVLVKDSTKLCGYQLALLSSDRGAAEEALVSRYADRWSIEVAFEEAKHIAGVGQARNRAERAVERTVPFQFLCQTLAVAWYALHGHDPADVEDHRARAPWYRTKANPSFADMIAKLRRVIIASQFPPGRGRTPTPVEIAQVQEAWAVAGV